MIVFVGKCDLRTARDQFAGQTFWQIPNLKCGSVCARSKSILREICQNLRY